MNQMTPLPEKEAWRALAAMMIGFFMLLLDATVVAVATPQFQEQLGASLNAVVWVTSVYLLTGAVPLLVTGRLGDRYGQRTMYLWGTAIFTLSSLACGLAPNIGVLIVARAVQGFGGAIISPQIMSVISRIFPREKQGAAMGVWGMVAGLATLAGPLLGGMIVGLIGWHWVFFINVPIGVLSLVMTMKWLPELPRTARRIDLPSVGVSMIAVFFIVFGLQQGQATGWPTWSWLMLVGGVILTILFLLMQFWTARRGEDPLVPMVLFTNRNFSIGSFSITTVGFAMGGYALPVMIYLQQAVGLRPEYAGLMLMPMAVISGVLSPLSGRLSDRLHPRTLSMFGFGMMALGFIVAAIVMRDGTSFWWMLIPICMQGLGNAFVWSPNSANTMRDVDRTMSGAASGVYNTTRQVGSVMGAAAVGALMQWGESFTSLANAMGNAMLAPGLAMALGFVAILFFAENRTHLQAEVDEVLRADAQ